jgi:hypothetical protein
MTITRWWGVRGLSRADGIQRHGGRRREWSLSSKVLHWLMPWRVPAYDALVREALGVQLGSDPEVADAEVVGRVFDLATCLRSKAAGWIGALERASWTSICGWTGRRKRASVPRRWWSGSPRGCWGNWALAVEPTFRS